jgi:L,D-transpeptidase YnhG
VSFSRLLTRSAIQGYPFPALFQRWFWVLFLIFFGLALTHFGAEAQQRKNRASPTIAQQIDGEERLFEVYRLINQGQQREALNQAFRLTQDLPNFQLAQLVYGDLLNARTRSLKNFGDVPDHLRTIAGANLEDLRKESQLRIRALRERPAPGMVPAQFLSLAPRSRHAIAVDASRSRLYLFENTPTGLQLKDDFYVTLGKAGINKKVEGDQRTPLGIYYVTSRLDPATLKDFYGSGALPINYPNVLDLKRGQTGSGIWLHGTPPNQFVRAPLASDGCVVLANPDFSTIARMVEPRTTPVIIATQLQWVASTELRNLGKPFENTLFAWRNAKTSGNLAHVMSFYANDFAHNGKDLNQWLPTLKTEMAKTRGRTIQLKDVTYLHWKDTQETMVVTFGEVAEGLRAGLTKRQYWVKQGSQWKIFYEGVL